MVKTFSCGSGKVATIAHLSVLFLSVSTFYSKVVFLWPVGLLKLLVQSRKFGRCGCLCRGQNRVETYRRKMLQEARGQGLYIL